MVFQAWKTVEVNKWSCAPLERDFLDPGPCCLPKNRSTRTTHTNRKSMDDVQELCRYYMNYTTLTCILCASSFNPQYSTYSINGRDRLLDVRKKNQQQLIFPSVLSPVACAPPRSRFRFRSLKNQTPLPRKLRAPLAELSACVTVFVLFQVPKLVKRSTRVEYFRHGVRLRQCG